MALSDVDGVAFALVDDGPRVDLVWQTIIRDGAELLSVFGGNDRQSTVQASIPTPVLLAVDGKIDASVLYRAITATAIGPGLKLFDSQFKEETGLDLRADILDNVTGAAGFALLNLETEADADDWAAMSWVQLVDEGKAKSAAERFFTTHQSEIKLEQIAGTTVYATDGFLSIKFFIHGGHLFVAMGSPDIESIIKGPSDSLATNARIPEIGDAMAKGGLSAGFVDVRQLLFAIRPLLSDSEREQEKKLAPLVSPMEAVTMRTELNKRSIVSRLTLHTSWDHALPSMV
ncbi:MAG: hypothetical protein JKY37_11275 [Nannocystaceae bacterium]|nr:hypothetical protein [Nannocystaceae bacterium]